MKISSLERNTNDTLRKRSSTLHIIGELLIETEMPFFIRLVKIQKLDHTWEKSQDLTCLLLDLLVGMTMIQSL